MSKENQLSEEDLERVRQVTASGYNSVERGPFRGWIMLGVCWVVVIILGAIAYYIGKESGFM